MSGRLYLVAGPEPVAAAELCGRVADALGWTPRVGLEEGLARTVRAHRERRLL